MSEYMKPMVGTENVGKPEVMDIHVSMTEERNEFDIAIEWAEGLPLPIIPHVKHAILKSLRLASRLERPVSEDMLKSVAHDKSGTRAELYTADWDAMLAVARREAEAKTIKEQIR